MCTLFNRHRRTVAMCKAPYALLVPALDISALSTALHSGLTRSNMASDVAIEGGPD